MTADELARRHARAADITRSAGVMALDFFRSRETLSVETKGRQDWVSEADRAVEASIRSALLAEFPDDAILGEEGGVANGVSGYTWVIDPIDGTTNFLAGDPAWCVVLAGLDGENIDSGHVDVPAYGERFAARRGEGATRDGHPIAVTTSDSLADGSLGVGHSTRIDARATIVLLDALLEQGGLYRRGGSGALDLAAVACGRTIGYVEPHMNAWDCLASLLLIAEAGGRIQPFDMATMLAGGGRVVVAAPGVMEQVVSLTEQAYGSARGR